MAVCAGLAWLGVVYKGWFLTLAPVFALAAIILAAFWRSLDLSDITNAVDFDQHLNVPHTDRPGGRYTTRKPTGTLHDEATFLIWHEHSVFSHSEAVIAGIQAHTCVLRHTSCDSLPCSHFLEIYTTRSRFLERFKTAHVDRIRADIRSLCVELAKPPDEPVRIWLFTAAPYYVYVVHEGETTRRILGCVLAADKRRVPPEEWAEFWQGSDGDNGGDYEWDGDITTGGDLVVRVNVDGPG